MSHRIEEKIDIHKQNFFYLRNWLFENNAKELFPTRTITSIYYDNDNFSMYKDSIEGVLPRKKLRIRFYSNSKDQNFYLEKKISSVEGRFKTKEKVNISKDKIIKKIYDKDYGECNPKVMITYKRNYYFLKNTRVTIDNDINFVSMMLNKNYSRRKIILNKLAVELKSSFNYSTDQMRNDFPFNIIRFSKYCEAINSLIKV
tara:strand:+ start:318 stop:920 length:603 start_codon:yes stop_codon:yes gene_type:complete